MTKLGGKEHAKHDRSDNICSQRVPSSFWAHAGTPWCITHSQLACFSASYANIVQLRRPLSADKAKMRGEEGRMWFKLELEALDRTRPTAMDARLLADNWRRLLAARTCASESACFIIPHDHSNMSVELSVHSKSTETQPGFTGTSAFTSHDDRSGISWVHP